MSEGMSGWRALGADAFREVFEHSIDGVLFAVPDGRILAANPAACAMLQRSEDEICRLGRQGLADAGDPRWEGAASESARE